MKRQWKQTAVMTVILALGAVGAWAQATVTWDANPTTAGQQDGSGTWSTQAAYSNWLVDPTTGPNQAWVQGDKADILAGSGTITLGEPITASVVLRSGTSYTIAGSNIWTLLGIGNYNANHSLTINCPVAFTNAINCSGNITINGQISEALPNLAITFGTHVTLMTSNDFSGGLSAGSIGASLTMGNDHAAGSGTLSVQGPLYTTGGDRVITNHIHFGIGMIANTYRYRFGGGARITLTDPTPTTSSGGAHILNVDADTTAEFTGGLDGAFGVEKRDAGTLILSGDNTHNQQTLITEGFLMMNGTHSDAKNYTVYTNAAFGGIGTISLASGSTVIVHTAASLLPGAEITNSVGTLTITNGPLSLAENVIYEWEYDSGSGDLIQVYGNVILPSVATVNVTQVSSTLPSHAVILTANAFSGPGASSVAGWVITGDAQLDASLELNGSDLVLKHLVPATGTMISIR